MLAYQTPELSLDTNADKPLYHQIADGIIRLIEEGRLNSDIPVASTRILAGTLNVHRKTVVEAYEKLIAQGWLYTIPNKGTFVTRKDDEACSGETRHDISFTFHNFEPSKPLPSPGSKHWEIRFDDGVPDPGLSYIKQFMLSYVRAFIQKVRLKKPEMFENPIEHPDALSELNRMLSTYRGFAVEAARHCFIFGNNISLYLVSQVLFEKGDVVIVEDPGNPQAWEVFKRAGVEMIPVDVDGDGINTEQVRHICERHQIKAVYVTPASQYPTTVTLSQERRKALLDMAAEYRFAIIEADYEYEFWYGDEPARALIADDRNGSVIYLGCMSKMLPPFNFIGFVAGPPTFLRSLRALWSGMGHQGDAVLELAILGFMKEGNFMRYARKSSNVYKEKRLRVAELIEAYLPDVSYTLPQGGLAFYLRFRPDIDITRLIERLKAADIYISAPQVLSFHDKPVHGLRFGFASLPLSKIERGIKQIAETLPLTRKRYPRNTALGV